jgi:AhpD family alkylhydroperoxidase
MNRVKGEAKMERIRSYWKVSRDGIRALRGLDTYVRNTGLGPGLLDLVRIRVSQLNGCAYCLDLHTRDARARGEAEQRLYTLSAWRSTPFYTDRERAALAWAEAVTLVGREEVSDAVFADARRHFSDRELVDLTLAIIAINGWNRLSIAFGTVPGTDRPASRREMEMVEAS